MNNMRWYLLYIVLFFSILTPATLFLFSHDHSRSAIPRITMAVIDRDHLYPTQTTNPNNPASCINDLLNNLQAGNLDLNTLQEGISNCFGLNTNGSNVDNHTQVIPQPPNASIPRFV